MRKTLLILVCAFSGICAAQSTRQTIKSSHSLPANSTNEPGTVSPLQQNRKLDNYYPGPAHMMGYNDPGGGTPSIPKKVD